jgi:hypothetical protein
LRERLQEANFSNLPRTTAPCQRTVSLFANALITALVRPALRSNTARGAPCARSAFPPDSWPGAHCADTDPPSGWQSFKDLVRSFRPFEALGFLGNPLRIKAPWRSRIHRAGLAAHPEGDTVWIPKQTEGLKSFRFFQLIWVGLRRRTPGNHSIHLTAGHCYRHNRYRRVLL